MKKIMSIALCLAMILQLFAVCMPVLGLKAEAAGENAVYVSPDGNDSWSGTIDKPFKTLGAARYTVNKSSMTNPVIYLREGTYYIDNTLSFSSNDKSVTISAYNNENVVFSGGYRIDWQTEYWNGRAVWTADIDTTKISGKFNTLYGQGGLLSNSRLPETGYFYAASGEDPQNPSNVTFSQNKAFKYKNNDITEFYDYQNVHLRLFHFWVDEYLGITNIDTANKKVTIDRNSGCTINTDDAYYLENVREAFDKPGEWYMDYNINKLYYIPFENESINSANICAGGTEKLMSISGASGITFNGITFSDTNWEDNGSSGGQADSTEKPCIEITNSSNISFTDCKFTNIGETCLRITDGSSYCTVDGCEFTNIGSHAVYISGPNSETGKTHHITVTDNYVYNYGLMRMMAVAILQTYAQYSVISHNEIHRGAYTAISVGWTWGYAATVNNHNTVSDNLIYDIGHAALSDMGGIYLLGLAEGTVISGNVISDVAAGKDASTYGGWGIYLDEGSTSVTVRDNLVYDCDSQGYHQHYGQVNLIQNNIFAFNKDAQIRSSRNTTAEELGSTPVTELYLYNNIIAGDGQMLYQMAAKGRFTDNNNLYYDYLYSTVQNDVYSSTDNNQTIKNKSEMQSSSLGYYKNGKFADPCFIDPENRNFNFANNSGYSQISFTPYDFSNAGSQKFGSRYLVNNLDHAKSWYDSEKWNRYESAKNSAVADRNAETISELEQAYNALKNSQQGTAVSSATVTNTADWKMTGKVRKTILSTWKEVTYAEAKTNLFVSGVSHGNSIADSADSVLTTAYPTVSQHGSFDVEMRRKDAAASAVMYVDTSVYSDMSQTDLKIGGNVESASGQGMRYYCGLAAPNSTTLDIYGQGSYTTGLKTYSITKGLENSPIAGMPKSVDIGVSSNYFNKTVSGRLSGPVPSKNETVNMRIVGYVLIHRTSECELNKQDPTTHYYYCVNSYLDLSLIGVDKSVLREAYNEAVAGGRTDSAVTNASAVLLSNDKSQAEIDAAVAALSTAGVNKTALLNAINLTPAYSSAEYTAQTWDAYYTSLENGRAVYDDPFATQSEVDAAASALVSAYNELIDCRKLINEFTALVIPHEDEYSQYAWYEFGDALNNMREAFINSTSAEQDNKISEFKEKYESLISHPAESKKVYHKLTQHKPNECMTTSTFYTSGVTGGTNCDDTAAGINFDNKNYDNSVEYSQWNLIVASNNKHATANMYVDRSLYSDMSETTLRIGANLDYIVGGSYRLYIMFVNDYTPTIGNNDSKTVNGKTYTVGIGTYNNPVLGQPGGGNTTIEGIEYRNIKGNTGTICGPVPNAGETVSFRLAACIFNQNFARTAFYCANSYIDFNIYGVDKSQLREYTFETYASAPEGCDTSSAEYAEYQEALAAADNVIYTDTYAQNAIDAAAQRLKTAYESIKPKPVVTVDFGGAEACANLVVWNTVSYNHTDCGYPSFTGHKCSYTVSGTTVTFTPESTEQGYAYLPLTLNVEAGKTYSLSLKSSSDHVGFLAYNSKFTDGWNLFPSFYQFTDRTFTLQDDGTYLFTAKLTISDNETAGSAYLRVEEQGYTDAAVISDIQLTEQNAETAGCTGTYSEGDIITLPAVEKDGFDFKGWMLSDGTMLTGNEYTVGSADETVTAVWSERILYSDVSSVDYRQNIIYGFEPALDDLSDYIGLKESGCNVVYEKASSKVGTGTLVKVYRNGELKETYTAVLFGDVTGDGWYDGNDAVVVSCIANGMLDEKTAGFAEYMAADCNHDGLIDEFDVEKLNDAGVLLAQVNQADDPLTVASLYTEYLNAVSQTPDAADDTPTSEPENDGKVGVFDYIASFFRRIAEIILSIVEFVKNIF